MEKKKETKRHTMQDSLFCLPGTASIGLLSTAREGVADLWLTPPKGMQFLVPTAHYVPQKPFFMDWSMLMWNPRRHPEACTTRSSIIHMICGLYEERRGAKTLCPIVAFWLNPGILAGRSGRD